MTDSKREKPYLKTLVFGIVSIASYLILYTLQDVITEYYTRGGAYAAFPVVTALYFSLVHGAFASNVLSMLGIEAAKGKLQED